MTCSIVQFPRKQIEKLPEIEAWIDEVDELGPFPAPIKADYLMLRCPDKSNPTALWLAGFAQLADRSSTG